MKYSELLEALKEMTGDQLNAEVMVFENGEDGEVCHCLGEDIHLNTAPFGAMQDTRDGSVTDDYYGVGEEVDDMKVLLECNMPYLMVGFGGIPTSRPESELWPYS